MNLPGEAAPAAEPDAEVDAERGPEPDARRRVSRAFTYIDALNAVMGDVREFSLDDAWERVRPTIRTSTSRPRDGLRSALERDEGFRRLEDDTRDGIWYRRRGAGLFEGE